MSIRARIIISHLIIIGIGFFYLVKRITDTKEIKSRYMESVEEPMVDMAHLLASIIELDTVDGTIDPQRFRDAIDRAGARRFVAQIYNKRKTSVDLHVYITDAQGIVLFDSEGRAEGDNYSQRNDVYLTMRGKYGARSTKQIPGDPTSSVLHVAAPITHQGEIVGVLTVSKPQKSMAQFMTETRQKIFVMGAIAATLVVLAGSILSAWLTRPILRLTEYAKAVRDGGRVPLPKLGGSEIATLGRAFEEMRDALDGRKYIENYVQTLTHEIKSPVAAIRGAVELLHENMPVEQRDRFLQNIQAETIRIQEVVDRLLLLSAVEAKKTLDERTPVNLCSLLRETIASTEPQRGAKRIQLQSNLPDQECTVEGDSFLLEAAISNLLQNAIEFAADRGRIDVTLVCVEGRAVMTIEDDGPGIPAYALPRVFERFFSLPRPDIGKKSSGLGLAFVREVAELHRGEVTLENGVKAGVIARLQLPAAG